MGTGATRTFGPIREILPGNTEARTASQGVKVEVGERQAAIDLDLVVEYGVAIADLAGAVRKNVIERLQRMTGLEVTEVNINATISTSSGTRATSRARRGSSRRWLSWKRRSPPPAPVRRLLGSPTRPRSTHTR